MTPIQVFERYCALKAHFSNGKYDFHKYRGKIRVKPSTFERRNDKYFFYRLAKTFKNSEVVPFLLANMISSNGWIGNMDLSTTSQTVYTEWKKRIESLTYVFKTDMEKIMRHLEGHGLLAFNDLFMVEDGTHPTILKMYFRGFIHFETFIIMNEVLVFFPYFDKRLGENELAWADVKNRAIKYKSFLKIDALKFKKIMQKNINILAI